MADLHDRFFGHFYQSLLFRESTQDSFERASNRRKRMALALQASLKWSSDLLSSAILDDHFEEYGSLVDARGAGEIDNYSASACAVALNSENHCSQWISSFEEIISIPDSLSSIHDCECNKIRNEDLKKLLDAKRENISDNNSFPCNSATNGDQIYRKDMVRRPSNIAEMNAHYSTSRLPLEDSNMITNNSSKVNSNTNALIQHQKHQPATAVAIERTESLNSSGDGCSSVNRHGHFITAREELSIQNQKKGSQRGHSGSTVTRQPYHRNQKRLGTSRRPQVNDEFVLPVRPEPGQRKEDLNENEEDERLKGIDPKMVEMVKNEIIDNGTPVNWDDIAGLEFAKATIKEIVVWPLLRPDIFFGLRGPPKGLLLFGPPGTGKTLIGKCIASQSKSTFFSISASSLTSKWIGEGEKMVRALFAVARCHPPAVIFIDEIDSLLTQRNETDHESSRRIKTEFLVQLDGAATSEDDRILVIGATNRPQELDEAARRRLVKRLYIPLPEFKARRQIIDKLMSSQRNNLTSDDIDEVAKLTEGYSGADMKNLCREAALGPIRSIRFEEIENIKPDQVRPVVLSDFTAALSQVKASVSSDDLNQYIAWNNQYGCVEPK